MTDLRAVTYANIGADLVCFLDRAAGEIPRTLRPRTRVDQVVVIFEPSTARGSHIVGAICPGKGNVPLNDQLAAVSTTDPAASELWEHYLDRWTMWNHVRTTAAMLAALLYSVGLMQSAGM